MKSAELVKSVGLHKKLTAYIVDNVMQVTKMRCFVKDASFVTTVFQYVSIVMSVKTVQYLLMNTTANFAIIVLIMYHNVKKDICIAKIVVYSASNARDVF